MEHVSLEGLVSDHQEAGLFRINRRVFTDPEILELGKERVVARCWHELFTRSRPARAQEAA